MVWSETCGILKGFEGNNNFGICTSRDSKLVSKMKHAEHKKDTESLSIVRLNVTEKTSIILVNCENLLDQDLYVKRSKRSKCGICSGCELGSDCLSCAVCSKRQESLDEAYKRSSTTHNSKGSNHVTSCIKRKCINPIFNVSSFLQSVHK